MKVLFPIRACSFLVSISESAWASFARRGLAIRDVFDSSLDTVVQVEPPVVLRVPELGPPPGRGAD